MFAIAPWLLKFYRIKISFKGYLLFLNAKILISTSLVRKILSQFLSSLKRKPGGRGGKSGVKLKRTEEILQVKALPFYLEIHKKDIHISFISVNENLTNFRNFKSYGFTETFTISGILNNPH